MRARVVFTVFARKMASGRRIYYYQTYDEKGFRTPLYSTRQKTKTADVLEVTKNNTQKIERKHLSLRTWCARLVRKVIRFSKTERMHKIVVARIRVMAREMCYLEKVENISVDGTKIKANASKHSTVSYKRAV
jgi:IS1 family transposase